MKCYALHIEAVLRRPVESGFYPSVCVALQRARNRGVVFVAASGNDANTGRGNEGVDFPANATVDGIPLAVAVGGVQPDGNFWSSGYKPFSGSNWGSPQALVAPAKDVISTFYRDQTWSPTTLDRCADKLDSYTNTFVLPRGYGDCNGTSMAAPHVAALAGLVKSADPLRNTDEVRTVLLAAGKLWPNRDPQLKLGYGVPDAAKAVQQALDAYSPTDPIIAPYNRTNRLTPLFSLFSAKALDHFYTTVPQMAAAALDGTLRPRPKARAIVPGSSPENAWSVCCTEQNSPACSNRQTSCSGKPVPLPLAGLTVNAPDGLTKLGGVQVAIAPHPQTPDAAAAPFLVSFDSASPYYGGVTSSTAPGTLGQILNTTYLTFPAGETPPTIIFATPLDDAPLVYNALDKDFPVDPNHPEWAPAIARKVPEYNFYPAYLYCNGINPCPTNWYTVYPSASVRIYTSYKNPFGGADLLPLYRMSVACQDIGTCSSNPYHVSHAYSTDITEVNGYINQRGYKLDGIEGYVLPTQVSGSVALCRRYSSGRDDYVLFPGSGTSGVDCSSATSFEGGTYDSPPLLLGFVFSVTSDSTRAARDRANIQTAVWRPSQGKFYVDHDLNSTADAAVLMGNPADKPVAGDFDGDGITDFVIFQTGQYGVWNIDINRDGVTDLVFNFGLPGDVPLLGDFDGDGKADLVLYRNGLWYVHSDHNNNNGSVQYAFAYGGMTNDKPFVGDFDADGRGDIGVFRDGTWYVSLSSQGWPTTGSIIFNFGAPGDVPIVGDWDKDGIADLGVFRTGAAAWWYINTKRDGFSQTVYPLGISGDAPLVGRFLP